jgi:trans-aconitate methyltransferase
MRYKPFLDYIVSQHPTTIAEMGCGAANITKLLVDKIDSQHFCLDADGDMLHLAERSISSNIKYTKGDIREFRTTQKFDVIHSHGVLEHLSDDDIKKTINNQLKMSNKLIHYVPSHKYEVKSFGDERLLTVDQWKKLHKPTNILEFNNGFDYILIWEQ